MEGKDLAKKIKEANYPVIDVTDLKNLFPNRFMLTAAVSKRARQIAEGAKPTVEFYPDEPYDPIAIALKELLLENIKVELKDNVDNELEMIEDMDVSLNIELEESDKKVSKKSDKDQKKSKSFSTL